MCNKLIKVNEKQWDIFFVHVKRKVMLYIYVIKDGSIITLEDFVSSAAEVTRTRSSWTITYLQGLRRPSKI